MPYEVIPMIRSCKADQDFNEIIYFENSEYFENSNYSKKVGNDKD